MKTFILRIMLVILPVLLVAGVFGFTQVGRAVSYLFIAGTAAPVLAPVDGVTDVAWGLDSTDSSLVDSADVTFDGLLLEDSFICVQVSDSSTTILANGCATILTAGGLLAGTSLPVAFDSAVNETASAAAITAVNITVIQPVAPIITGAPIEIIDVRWVLLETDTSLVRQVEIDFAPFGGNVNSCGNDNECNFEVLLALQNSDGFFLAQFSADVVLHPCPIVSPVCTTIIWDLTLVDPISAEAITRFTIGVKPDDPWDAMPPVPAKVGHGAGMTTDGTVIYLLVGNGQDKLFRFDPAGPGGVFWTKLEGTPRKVTQGGALVYATHDLNGNGDIDPDERFLYAIRGGFKNDFWRYDILAGSWESMASLPEKVKWGGALTWDGEDTIYAFRGGDTKDFWSYQIPTGPWTLEESTPDTVKEGAAMVFVEGDPLVATDDAVFAMQGGADMGFWKFEPSGGPGEQWLHLEDFPFTVGRGGAITSDGVDIIYALRGDDTKEIYRFGVSPPFNSWVPGPDIPLQMREGGTLVFLGGDVYATQGRQQKEFLRISPLPQVLPSAE